MLKKYRHGIARVFILTVFYLTALSLYAEQMSVLGHTRKDLPIKIETSNLDSKGYVWQIEITPNQNSQQIQIKLLNPNPELSLLNSRALTLARQFTLAQLPQINLDSKNITLNQDEQKMQKTHFYYGKYTLIIKFPKGFHYASKTDFSNLQQQLEPFCHLDQKSTTNQSKLKPNAQGDLQLNAQLFVNTEGSIYQIKYSPLPNSKMIEILNAQFKKIRFYSYNKYGTPASFSVLQPIMIQCNSKDTNNNSNPVT